MLLLFLNTESVHSRLLVKTPVLPALCAGFFILPHATPYGEGACSRDGRAADACPTDAPRSKLACRTKILVGCQAAFASKPAPTFGSFGIRKIGAGCQAVIAGKPAPTFKIAEPLNRRRARERQHRAVGRTHLRQSVPPDQYRV